MPAYYVRNDNVQNGLGQAVPDAQVTYYNQPAMTLATVYSSPTGGAAANPQITNGLGQTTAYLAPGQYTITYSGTQIQLETFPDQNIGGSGTGSTVIPFAGVPQGTINGVNRTFTLTNGGTPLSTAPTQSEVWNNYPLVPSVGYTLTGVTIVYTTAPVTGDTLWAQGVTIS